MILLYSLEWLQLKKWVIIPWMIDRISYRFTNITISITVKSLNGTISVLHADYVQGRGFEPRSDRIIQDISDLPRVLTHIQEANGCVVYGEALRPGKGYRRADGGYEYKNLGVKGYVHGNLDAVALIKGKVKPLGNSGFISRFYTVQHCLTGPAQYEFVFTNPTSRKIKIIPSISHSPNQWSKSESFQIASLGTYTHTVIVKQDENAYVRFKSHLYLGRPVVFRIANDSMDVFHG